MKAIKDLARAWREFIPSMISDKSVGVDFKQEQLVLTLLRRSFARIVLVDYGVYPLSPEGQREEREVQAISLVNAFVSKHQVSRERVSIAIPREKVIARFIRLPIAVKENLQKVLEYETPKYIPFEKGEIYFDYCLLNAEEEWLHLFAVFARKADIDSYVSLLKKMGIQPLSIQIPSVAALNLFFYNKGGREGETSVLVDVGEPFLEMNLVRGKNWEESFHLPLPKGEREKRIINTFKRSANVDPLERSTLFVYGLGADEALPANLKEADQLKGVSRPPMDRIQVEGKEPKPDKIYASIGVPLKGLISLRVDLNLLPPDLRKKTKKVGRPLLIALTFLALFFALTWGLGAFMHYRKELEAVNDEIRKRRPAVEALEKLQKQRDEYRKEMAELVQIRSGEISKVLVLEELTRLLPDTTWIWNLKYNGKEMELSGFADSASDLIPLLDRSSLFEKVEFLAPVTKETHLRGDGNKEKERFKIKAKIEGRR